MMKKPKTSKDAADKVVKNIRRKTRQTYSSEEKIRIVLAGLRGEESISVPCPQTDGHRTRFNTLHRLSSLATNEASNFQEDGSIYARFDSIGHYHEHLLD